MNDGSAEGTVATLNTLDNNTTGTINAGSITSMTGLLADFLTAYGSNGITGLNIENIVSYDTSVSVTDLNTLDLLTWGTINANSITDITGSVAALNTAYSSQELSILELIFPLLIRSPALLKLIFLTTYHTRNNRC